MSKEKDTHPRRNVQRRIDAFVDCLARLMAKRWLREQQNEPDGEIEGPQTETDDDSGGREINPRIEPTEPNAG